MGAHGFTVITNGQKYQHGKVIGRLLAPKNHPVALLQQILLLIQSFVSSCLVLKVASNIPFC